MTIAALAPYYLWTKSFHLISDFAWMAALLYLPRLFVYHCAVPRGSAESERFKVMERRLLKQIAVPAMMFAWLFGIILVLTPGAIGTPAGGTPSCCRSYCCQASPGPCRSGGATSWRTATAAPTVFTGSPTRYRRCCWWSSSSW